MPRFWREQPQRYRLVASECQRCTRVHFPPRTVCPSCRRESLGKLAPRQLTGVGKVLTWTEVRQPAPGFENQTPYVMGIVELEEGCRVMSQIVDVDAQHIESGLAVEACFRKIREDGKSGVIYYGYKFRPLQRRATTKTEVVVQPRALKR